MVAAVDPYKLYLPSAQREGAIVFSSVCLSVCVFVCLSVYPFANTITPESLEISSRNLQGIILFYSRLPTLLFFHKNRFYRFIYFS